MQIQLKDLRGVNNGARFLSVDLHIHSYGGSADVADPKMTVEAIVDSAFKQGLSVIAITDHNSDANVAKAIAYGKKFVGEILVLAGTEVTTSNGHLLSYFDPERPEFLERFLAKIDLVGAKGAAGTHTKMSMADAIGEAEQLGGICIAAHIDRDKTGFEMFAPGFQNWKRDIVWCKGLYGFECDSIDALRWYSPNDHQGSAGTERKKIFMDRKVQPGLLGREGLAHIQGSDSHSLASFETPQATKPWTRIKMTDLTWQSFRTAMVDPEARVRAVASVPPSVPRIIGFGHTGGFLNGEIVHLSGNLNCFIGGRGTGKSTAIRSLAYGFGEEDSFEDCENCPESIQIFCEDATGTLFLYERSKGGEVAVKAKEEGEVPDVPVDAFRIEYFGQGELSEVAKDPPGEPELLQQFLDRHLNLTDLIEKELGLLGQLQENGARLGPLESENATLSTKDQALADVETKLTIAEEGNLKEIVNSRRRVQSEKTIAAAVEEVAKKYETGISLAQLQHSYKLIAEPAGDLTNDPKSTTAFAEVDKVLNEATAELKAKTKEINTALKKDARELRKQLTIIKSSHAPIEAGLAADVAKLKEKGLAGNMAEINGLLKSKTAISTEINKIKQREAELKECRTERKKLLDQLHSAQAEMGQKRKAQLETVNSNLSRTIDDYLVFLRYEEAGMTEAFEEFTIELMSGLYFPKETARQLCEKVTPQDLVEWAISDAPDKMSSKSDVAMNWSEKVLSRLSSWEKRLELQVLTKAPRPSIIVKTRTTPSREILVTQLSDGQRHTILLTIAMMAETNVPLLIDQPEDDLDNAFIASSIVQTLRAIKEHRQVILVTHNANIAVLGDSELMLPMARDGDYGKVDERGSIDREKTKQAVLRILEGGNDAFTRRQSIYGH